MSNDNFQTPVSCTTSTGTGRTHKDERETHINASPGMTDSQFVRPGLVILTVPQLTHSDDTDAHSSGNDSTERESEGHMGRETSTCSSHNGKGSTTETTESKRYVIFKSIDQFIQNDFYMVGRMLKEYFKLKIDFYFK